MKANLLSFIPTFRLDNSPADVTITDDTSYSSNAEIDANGVETFAIANSQVEGIINARLPNGNLFYDGDDTFATPDIDRGATDQKTGIELTLDANGDYYLGDYEIEYKVRVTGELYHFPVASLSNSGGKGIIAITGNYKDIIEDQTLVAILTGHPDVGAKTFETVSYSSSTGLTTVQIAETFTDLTTAATFAVTATRTYSLTSTFNFNYTASVVDITLEADCDKSQLQSIDATDYSQYDGDAPSSRTHTLKYPRDLSPAKADIVSPQDTISINPIYTNNWTSTIASTVIKTGTDGLIIQDLLEGTNNINVKCDTRLCTIYACLENISTNYENSIKNQNQTEHHFWGNLWIKVQGWLHLYKQAKACGSATNATTYYNKIVAAANTASCCPDTTAGTGVSTLVVPVTSGGLTTTYNELVNQWLTGTGVPSDSIGNDGDFYLKNAAPDLGDVYQKGSGTWGSPIMNIAGADGLDGAPGANGTNGVDGTALLFSDATKRTLAGATAGLQDMTGRSYTISSGTLTPKEAVRVVFDTYRVDASKLGEQLNLKIGSNDLTFDLPFETDQYRYEVDIVPESTTAVKILWRWFSSFSNGQASLEVPTQVEPGNSYQSQGAITVLDLDANNLTIKVQGNVQASNSFISQMMRVERLKTT